MGIRAASPTPRELPLSNQTWFRCFSSPGSLQTPMNSGFDTFMGQFVVQRRPASRRTPSQYELSKVGFPIRKSSDQSLFAAPQGLSQRTTSFIASQRQGIHRMPLRHLIVLMIDARPLGRGAIPEGMDVGIDQKDQLLRT